MDLEDLRLAVYGRFASAGQAPTAAELAEKLGWAQDDVIAGLGSLAAVRHLVLGADGSIIMAHPFSAVDLGFSVMGRSTLWWGGCAWDSFALPHLLADAPSVLVATQCPACRTAHAWVVDRSAPPAGEQVAHFLIPVHHMWDNVVHTCSHQRLFCSAACVDAWLAKTGNAPGYVMDLVTLWRLAEGWYAGRLSHGYVRREPSAAQDYLRSVGLDGPFWGL